MNKFLQRNPQARLAMTRAAQGLTRARNGWRSNDPAVDPFDLINFRTVNALAAQGQIVLAADRQTAIPASGRQS